MTQKEIASQCLTKLDIYKPYIRGFNAAKTATCFFENFGGFWTDQEEELYKKIKEVEKDNNVLVYAVTHEFLGEDEVWSMLCVDSESQSVDDCLDPIDNNTYYAFAYVWNQSCDFCSEFGDVVIKSAFGGIKRIS